MLGASDEERFWRQVAPQGDELCWSWLGTVVKTYGYLQMAGHRRVLAHRFAYELLVGPIPNGLEIDHLCRNRTCVNPSHLEPVTRGENIRRSTGITNSNAAKTHCPQGHEYSPENTIIGKTPLGGDYRICATCRTDRERRR